MSQKSEVIPNSEDKSVLLGVLEIKGLTMNFSTQL
jgi:hypothetical protein